MRPILLACLIAALSAPAPAVADDAASAFQSRALPVLKNRCAACHGRSKQKAGLNLEAAGFADPDLWFRVLDEVESNRMPPAGKERPSPAEREALRSWVQGEYADLLAANQRREGRSKLRRLSRSEYADTLEDLFGIRPNPDDLPWDGRVDGYDKVSAALPLTSEGSFAYLTLAEDFLRRWVLQPTPKEAGQPIRSPARESEQSKGHLLELGDGTVVSFNSDVNSGPFRNFGIHTPGLHKIRVSVYAYQTDKPLAFGIYVGNTWAYPQQLELAKVLEAPPGKPAVLETEIYLRANTGARLIPFGLGVPVPKNSQASQCKAPGLAVQWIEDTEPERPLLVDRWLCADLPKPLVDEMRRQNGATTLKGTKAVTRDAFLAAMHATFRRIGARFFRRDLTATELRQILQDIARQIDAGAPLAAAFLEQVIGLMTSPDFFCLIESPGTLPDFALASRLSYLLWNSTPDEALLEVARRGRLRDPKVLREQADRMLNDPKSERFVRGFTDQWLGLQAINDTSPDARLYPEYGRNELLKQSSVQETRDYVARMLKDNLSVRAFVDNPWVLVNGPLAEHYGLPGVAGAELRQVVLPADSPYGGLWTQSAVMKVTANGTNTSPVKRGVWVARRLLGIAVPPPPPKIAPVEPDTRGAKTLREQLELHRRDPSCGGCHAKFDPYGFALESFDVTGGFRKAYRIADAGRKQWREGLPVDCSGTMPDGRAFSGIGDLRKMLAAKPEQLAIGVTRHLITYATGRAAGPADFKAVDAIVKGSAADGYGLRSIVHDLIQSDLFRSK